MPDKALDLKFTCSATQQRILGKNPARVYALFVNDNALADIYLSMGIPAVAGRGIRINAGGGSYEINLTNPWHGEVYAVGTAASPTLLVQEW